MAPRHFLRPADRHAILTWYEIRGMVNADGTIQAHNEEDRQFVVRVHGMSQGHRTIQRELIEESGDKELRDLVTELSAATELRAPEIEDEPLPPPRVPYGERFRFPKDDVEGIGDRLAGPFHVLFTNSELHIETRCYPDGSTRTFDTSTGKVVPDPPTDLYSVEFTSRILHTETRRYLDGGTRTFDTSSGKVVQGRPIKDGRPLWAVRDKVARGAPPTGPDPLAGWLATADGPTWDVVAEGWRARWCSDLDKLSTGQMSSEQREWIIEQLNRLSSARES